MFVGLLGFEPWDASGWLCSAFLCKLKARKFHFCKWRLKFSHNLIDSRSWHFTNMKYPETSDTYWNHEGWFTTLVEMVAVLSESSIDWVVSWNCYSQRHASMFEWGYLWWLAWCWDESMLVGHCYKWFLFKVDLEEFVLLGWIQMDWKKGLGVTRLNILLGLEGSLAGASNGREAPTVQVWLSWVWSGVQLFTYRPHSS